MLAHPSAQSLNAELANLAVTTLSGRHVVAFIDLWREVQRRPTTNEHPLVGVGILVLVYPTWWGGPPAPLKQWLDDQLSVDAGSFCEVRRLVVITTHGSPHWVNRLQGEPGRLLTMRGLRSRCHRLTRRRWLALYGLDRDDPLRRSRFRRRVETTLARL